MSTLELDEHDPAGHYWIRSNTSVA
jgi:hypothetical protein